MKITSLDGKTPDIAEENIQKLRQIFPNVFTEDKVDFEKLQQVLGEYVEDSTERYNFTWNGKGRALRLSQTPSLGTLRPCKEESKDWDTTQNLYIEGDNLEVLKLLQKSYHGKVKMIYIDPPYNTGKDFVYKDDFHESLENYKRITGQVDKDGNRLSTNAEASGRYHTDWLNMMYPRLRLARNLLTDDGVIFISIGKEEMDNLIHLMKEVFGEINYLTTISRITKKTSDSGDFFAPSIDYIISFGKNIDLLDNFKIPLSKEQISGYNLEDKNGRYKTVGFYQASLTLERSRNARYFIECPDGSLCIPPKNKRWRTVKETYETFLAEDKIVFKQTPTSPLYDENGSKSIWNIYTKSYLDDRLDGGMTPREFIDDIHNVKGTKELKELKVEFDFPKPTQLINYLMTLSNSSSNDIILDFFSGSATTAHAVMQLNAEDGGNRKFIMVQLPEPTDEKSEAHKAGYMNICEIGKERIRRAGEKVKEEKGLEAQNLDIGFKVLKLDTSNIRKWQPDHDDLEQSLLDYVDNYVEGRTELDVVYEIMLKYGLDLTYPVDEFTLAQKKVYSIGFGMLMICLDDEITTEVAKGILEKVKELAPESTRVVFKDNGFKTDSNKTNIKEILKSGGIEEFITI